MDNKQLDELEIRFAFQEKQLDDISGELYHNQQAIAKLEQKLELILGKLSEISTTDQRHDPSDDKPPHY